MTAIAAFVLTSPATPQSAAPFMIGHAFKKGDVPTDQHLHVDLPNFSIVPLRRWNDGSVKHAAVIGRVDLTANVAKQINIWKSIAAPTAGTPLTAADIQAAAPTASVQCGTFGTVSLSDLLASPVRTFISTKEMVECHYSATVGADASLYVNFHVRLFADGRMFVRAVVGNGYLDGSEKVLKDYIPAITIGGVTAWNNGGAVYHHFAKQRYDITGWIGADPSITPKHDTGYLNRTKLVPNYWKTGPSQATIDKWVSVGEYVPGANLGYTPSMGNGGFQNQIGLLPMWDALYCASQGHPTMYRAVIAHARAINSYGVAYVDQATRNPIKISSFPTWDASGPNGTGNSVAGTKKQNNTTALIWEGAHCPSAGYLAYLLTADYYYLESTQMNGNLSFLNEATSSGSGLNRNLHGQNRRRGWAYRNISQAAAVYPDNLADLFGDISAWFANLMERRATAYTVNPPPSAWIGYEHLYNNRLGSENSRAPNGQLCVGNAPWEHHFVSASMGMASDIEPVDASAMANLNAFRDFVLGAPVWITGGLSGEEYNFGYASHYTVTLRAAKATSTASLFSDLIPANPGVIFADTFSDPVVCEDGAGNIGSASMSPASIDLATFTPDTLATPVTITYDEVNNHFTGLPANLAVSIIVGSTTTTYPAGTPVPYTRDALIRFGGVGVRITHPASTGTPEHGDTFTMSNSPTPVFSNPGTTMLMGNVSGSPAVGTGYWANLLPALAYAVDHGKPGAAAGWGRIANAPNFNTQDTTADYANQPLWGIVPRSHTQPALVFTAVAPEGPPPEPVTPSSPSVRVDLNSPIPGAVAIGATGMGIVGSRIASSGQHGPAPLYPSLDLPEDANSEFRMVITSMPAGLHLEVSEIDGSIKAWADFDGAFVVPIDIYKNTEIVGSTSFTLIFGAVSLVGSNCSQEAVSGIGVVEITAGSFINLVGSSCAQHATSGTGEIETIAPITLVGSDCAQHAVSGTGFLILSSVTYLQGSACSQNATSGTGSIVLSDSISAYYRYTVRPENRNYTVKG